MDPIVTVLRFGEVERIIGSYGVMLSVTILVASVIAARAAERAKLDVGTTIASLGLVTGGAAAGAFGLFAIVEWIRTGDPTTAFSQPGGVFFGAPIGGGIALVLSCRAFGLPLGRLVDVGVPAIPAAHAMGRIGCFLGGCCYGAPWDGPFAVTYTHPLAPAAHPPVPRHPAPLYESLGLLVLALAFTLVPPRRVGSGERLFAYFVAYGVLRFTVELFRGDAVRGLFFGGRVSTSQIISAAVAALALAALVVTRAKRAATAAVTP